MASLVSICSKLKCARKLLIQTHVEPRTIAAIVSRFFCDVSPAKTETKKDLEIDCGTDLLEFKGEWSKENKNKLIKDMRVHIEFITEAEEESILFEVEPHMKRLRYEYDHWDNAIHGYRETERKHWFPRNREVLDRVCKFGFQDDILPYIHVLDLSAEGVIKPHIDSTRYCGSTIAGVSLLSDSVMRLVYAINKKENNESKDYRSQPKATLENNFYVDILLPRRSLYVMSNYARYDFTHEILGNEHSKFRGQPVKKGRRISIICRNEA